MSSKRVGVAWWPILGAALLSGLLGTYGWREDSEDRDNHKDKLTDKEIRETLDILTNEVIQLKKEVREIKEGRRVHSKSESETENGSESEVTEMGSDGKISDEHDSKLKFLSVSRKTVPNESGNDGEEEDGKVQYIVRYRVPDTNASSTTGTTYDYVQWRRFELYNYTDLPETISNEIIYLPPGVRETRLSTTPQNDTYLLLVVGARDHRLMAFINNEENDTLNDVTETHIETPILPIVAPKGDIVYNPGHNATLKFRYLSGEDNQGSSVGILRGRNVDGKFVLAKPGDDKLIQRFNLDYDNNIFHKDEELRFLDKVETTVTIDTANISYSGVVEFSSAENNETGLVRRVEHQTTKLLRPSTQKGPFPDGMIYRGDFESYDTKIDENGNLITLCSYGKVCHKYCHAFGEDLSSMKLFKTVGGQTTQEPLQTLSITDWSYDKAGMFKVFPMEGDPFPVTYTCTFGNAKGQTESFHSVLVFGYDVEILRNETTMEKFDNHTARVVCTARGLPLPRVSIQCDYGETREPDEVVYHSDDVISVTVTCDDIDVYSYVESTFQCEASNDYQSDQYNSWDYNHGY